VTVAYYLPFEIEFSEKNRISGGMWARQASFRCATSEFNLFGKVKKMNASKKDKFYYRMAAMLRLSHKSVADGRYGAECPGCGRCIDHDANCRLTTLLKEMAEEK